MKPENDRDRERQYSWNEEPGTVLRRTLLKGAGVAVAGGLALGSTTAAESTRTTGAATSAATATDPVDVIFDTDMAGDVDDVGALATLHALDEAGEANLLAVGVSDKNEWAPLCADALNTYYDRPDVPIGTVRGDGAHVGSAYTEGIATEFPRSRSWESAADAPDAVDVYREVLADQPDDSVVIVSVGFLTNVANLLRSEPDEHSDLNGVDLVSEKVRLWVAMAGEFPEGHEYNVFQDAASAQYATDNWPTDLVFSGFGIGFNIYTGSGLADLPEDDPTRRAYELYNGLSDRHSWDQAAVLYAVRGSDGGPASSYWELSSRGRIEIDDEGNNTWTDDPNGRQRYKIESRDPDLIADEIETLMRYLPGGSQSPYGRSLGWPIPGTIDAEDYDEGGQAVAYYDTSPGNAGGEYRDDGVDVRPADGGYAIDSTEAGEWVEYTVDVETAGAYEVEALIASGGGDAFRLEQDGTDVSGSVNAPDTGGADAWETVDADVDLDAGESVIRFVFEDGGVALDALEFTLVDADDGENGDGDPADDSNADDSDAGDDSTVEDSNDDTDEDGDDEIPGFGVPGTIAGLGGSGYLLGRWLGTDSTGTNGDE